MKPLNIRDPFFVMTIIALSFFWYGTCQSNKVDKLKAENESRISLEQIKALEAKALKSDSLADAIELRAAATRVKDSIALRALKTANFKKAQNVHILREPVQPLLDTIKALAQFVRAYDSLLAGKDEEIKQLELRHQGQIVDLTEALKERGNQILAEASQKELWRVAAVESEKKVRKLQKGRVFRNVVIGVLTAGIVYVSIRE